MAVLINSGGGCLDFIGKSLEVPQALATKGAEPESLTSKRVRAIANAQFGLLGE